MSIFKLNLQLFGDDPDNTDNNNNSQTEMTNDEMMDKLKENGVKFYLQDDVDNIVNKVKSSSKVEPVKNDNTNNEELKKIIEDNKLVMEQLNNMKSKNLDLEITNELVKNGVNSKMIKYALNDVKDVFKENDDISKLVDNLKKENEMLFEKESKKTGTPKKDKGDNITSLDAYKMGFSK